MNRRAQYFVATLGLFVFLPRAGATDFIIPNGDVAALKAAINTANTNNQHDNILLAGGGTYNLTTIDNGVYNGLPIITSDSGHSVTINGNGATIQRTASFSIRIFDVTGNVTVANLTIANGNANGGGSGFRNAGGTSVLQNCTLRDNVAFAAAAGGAASNDTGNLTVLNCVFRDNISNFGNLGYGPGGAGIYNRTGIVTITGCSFTGNRARGGTGGITRGGALFNDLGGTMTITSCTLSDNSAAADGGAIYNVGTMMLRRSTLANNLVSSAGFTSFPPDSSGGAIANVTGTLTIENSTFSGNGISDTDGRGGAIDNRNGSVTLTACTLSSNTAPAGAGSGIHNRTTSSGSATVTLRNSILRNSAFGGNLVNAGAGASITSQGYNLCIDNGGGFLTAGGDQITTDPQLDASGLQDNGGPTRTIALLPTSPAIDKGKNFGLTTDQRGENRPNDLPSFANAVGGDGSDIGAFEVFDFVQVGPGFSVNTTGDHDDGVCGSLDCTLREAIGAANALSGANTINIAVSGTIVVGAAGSLAVTDSTTINGPGARLLTVSGNNARRVFGFSNGTSILTGLTIRDGFVVGSGIVGTAVGGGLTNFGTLTVNDCTFFSNEVLGAAGANGGGGTAESGHPGHGGAIHNLFGSTLNLNRCTFAANVATGGQGGANSGFPARGGDGGPARGAAIYNDSTSNLNLQNCTFSGNTATGGRGGDNPNFAGGNGGMAEGAGIYNLGTMLATSCTLSGNSGMGGAGGVGNQPINNGASGAGSGGLTNGGGTSTVRNTISAGNTGNSGPDAKGTFGSGGYNLIGVGDFATGFTAAADQVGTIAAPLSANLGPLQNNGGAGDTRALLSPSQAIDQGQSFGLTTDQRGRARPLDSAAILPPSGGDNSDIGAYEAIGAPFPISVVSRKVHGGAGTFDLDLPIAGNPGIECRSGGVPGTHQIIATFAGPITISTAGVSSGAGSVSTASASGNQVTIDLTGVANAQRLAITLFNVNNGTDSGDLAISMATLVGDTNGNGTVNATDIGQTKAASGQPVSAANFRADANVNGAINATDIGIVKSFSGTQLP